MSDGMPFLVAQISVPLVLAATLGLVSGLLLRSGTGRRPGGAPDADAGGNVEELVEARRSIEVLRAELSRVQDAKDTEMGRLETHAIEAMESTRARTEHRISALETELAQARAALRRSEDELTTQRGQTERLRKALSERDARISRLGENG